MNSVSSDVLERIVFYLSSWNGNSGKLAKRSHDGSMTLDVLCLKAIWQVEGLGFTIVGHYQKKKKCFIKLATL